jgi:hypothetical protein
MGFLVVLQPSEMSTSILRFLITSSFSELSLSESNSENAESVFSDFSYATTSYILGP